MKPYYCSKCKAEYDKWSGRCVKCLCWGTIKENEKVELQLHHRSLGQQPPRQVNRIEAMSGDKIASRIVEFDRVMSGGIMLGITILIGGDPGIGKSTILLQICNKLALRGARVLYVSAEESVYQTKIRAERLCINSPNLWLVSETDISIIGNYIDNQNPDIVVIDSIQMVFKPDVQSSPGTLTQIRESAMDMIYLCKRKEICLFLVGHITKDGSLAGPKSLEHMVDTVLYFEGDRFQSFRVLRVTKNRFGSTNEIGIFEMKEEGLIESNPSDLFIRDSIHPGTTTIATIIGTRPFLIEVQALVANTAASPARHVSGVDTSRVIMIMAIMERELGIVLSTKDIYVNIVGGIHIDEPAADLGIAVAIYSSAKNIPAPRMVLIGELGLTGEIRPVNHIETRFMESIRLGFDRVVVPYGNLYPDEQASDNKKTIKASYLVDMIEEIFPDK